MALTIAQNEHIESLTKEELLRRAQPYCQHNYYDTVTKKKFFLTAVGKYIGHALWKRFKAEQDGKDLSNLEITPPPPEVKAKLMIPCVAVNQDSVLAPRAESFPFPCPWCKSKYKLKSNYEKHVRACHSDQTCSKLLSIFFIYLFIIIIPSLVHKCELSFCNYTDSNLVLDNERRKEEETDIDIVCTSFLPLPKRRRMNNDGIRSSWNGLVPEFSGVQNKHFASIDARNFSFAYV
ncbi:hypothetical protein RFI_24002 [Reticulomyxa filosa]|uniref:C2H2-type domain-containing protein n=1 Tax=Reticulomyxa filosa TaxID=46433 RepID=X6MHB6_RETFI|nr:hypothetical protein RFI_24002 [Reticulomyxa filosa]|eukprot:ETO13373.1 hypothetical protein RFI_24002 [Reticulomyxa filosa]